MTAHTLIDVHIHTLSLTLTHTYTHTLSLSHTHTHTHMQGLFLCGRDIATNGTGGDIQGGWMAANAALGYTAADLMAGHNIASDLQKVSQ